MDDDEVDETERCGRASFGEISITLDPHVLHVSRMQVYHSLVDGALDTLPQDLTHIRFQRTPPSPPPVCGKA